MSRNCSTCPDRGHGGGPDPCSDRCDSCQDDPNTGFYGSTDHSQSFDHDEEDDVDFDFISIFLRD